MGAKTVPRNSLMCILSSLELSSGRDGVGVGQQESRSHNGAKKSDNLQCIEYCSEES